MRTMPLRFLVCAPVLVMAAHASATELIQNGNFGVTTGTLDHWTHTGQIADQNGVTDHDFASTSFAHSHSTRYSADFGIQNASSTSFSETLGQTFAPVSGASVTNVSLWAYTFEQTLTVELLYTDKTYTSVQHDFTEGSFDEHVDQGWRAWDLTTSVDPSKTLTGIAIRADSGFLSPTNDVFIDDVSVQAVPEPAPMAALGLGTLAFLKRRRR